MKWNMLNKLFEMNREKEENIRIILIYLIELLPVK